MDEEKATLAKIPDTEENEENRDAIICWLADEIKRQHLEVAKLYED